MDIRENIDGTPDIPGEVIDSYIVDIIAEINGQREAIHSLHDELGIPHDHEECDPINCYCKLCEKINKPGPKK